MLPGVEQVVQQPLELLVASENFVDRVVAGPVGGVGEQLVGTRQLCRIHAGEAFLDVGGQASKGVLVVGVHHGLKLASISGRNDIFPGYKGGEVMVGVLQQPANQCTRLGEGVNFTGVAAGTMGAHPGNSAACIGYDLRWKS